MSGDRVAVELRAPDEEADHQPAPPRAVIGVIHLSSNVQPSRPRRLAFPEALTLLDRFTWPAAEPDGRRLDARQNIRLAASTPVFSASRSTPLRVLRGLM